MSNTRFANQAAIVTGGASGIGFVVAKRLATEGARVWLLDLKEDALKTAQADLKAQGVTVETVSADITKDADVQRAMEGVSKTAGRLDILVNCAGIVGPNARKTTEVSLKEWEQVIAINLTGSFLVTKYALIEMQKRNYGRVLLFASISGKEGNAGMCPYSTSKAGVIGLVKAAGKEFAETGITVNAIAPGVIHTPMVESMSPAQVEYMTSKIPMKRMGTLDEVAALSCWIVSPESSFNTAFAFDLSGGRATY